MKMQRAPFFCGRRGFLATLLPLASLGTLAGLGVGRLLAEPQEPRPSTRS